MNSASDQPQISELELACLRRGELFARCFTRYAEAMNRLSHALDGYDASLRACSRWQVSAASSS
ncbi:MAG: hypothetical protein AAF328_06165 [Planctomycetota bacterium]